MTTLKMIHETSKWGLGRFILMTVASNSQKQESKQEARNTVITLFKMRITSSTEINKNVFLYEQYWLNETKTELSY